MYPIDGEMARPDDAGIHRPGIFDRTILRQRGAARDAIARPVIVKAVSEDRGSVVIRRTAAVASADVVPVIDLVINFDIELIIRGVRRAAENVIVKFARQIGLRIKIENGLADGIDFALGNYVQATAGLHLRPALTGGAGDQRELRIVDI